MNISANVWGMLGDVARAQHVSVGLFAGARGPIFLSSRVHFNFAGLAICISRHERFDHFVGQMQNPPKTG